MHALFVNISDSIPTFNNGTVIIVWSILMFAYAYYPTNGIHTNVIWIHSRYSQQRNEPRVNLGRLHQINCNAICMVTTMFSNWTNNIPTPLPPPPPPPPPPPLSRCGRPKVRFELLRMLSSNKMPIMCTSYRCVVHINTEDRWKNVLYECIAVRRLITPLYRFYPSSSLAPTKYSKNHISFLWSSKRQNCSP